MTIIAAAYTATVAAFLTVTAACARQRRAVEGARARGVQQ